MANSPAIIINFLREEYGKDISVYDDSFIDNSIRQRMKLLLSQTFDDYLLCLTDYPDEVVLLLASLNNSYSEFFRNPLTFAMLEQFILPQIFLEKEKSHSGEVRVWSAGCASGQEAYSLAMLLEDFIRTNNTNETYRIFATDSSMKRLDDARMGVYGKADLNNCRYRYIRNYFTVENETLTIDASIKQKIDFSVYDLLEKNSIAPPESIYGDFDLIMCSNVLIYYKPDVQALILDKFCRTLDQGGFLVTGEAEVYILKPLKNFRPYTVPAAIFKRFKS